MTSCPARRPRSSSASASSSAWAPGWSGSTRPASISTDAAGNASRLDTYTTVWAAGVEASPLAAELAKATGAELDRAGRIEVQPDLSLPGHPEVFVVGDMMALNQLPGVAEVAMQGGPARRQHHRPAAEGRACRTRSSTATSAAPPPSGGSGPW